MAASVQTGTITPPYPSGYATAFASYDEWILIPGTGVGTVLGNYDQTQAFPCCFASLEIAQANGSSQVPASLQGANFALSSTIQFGVPFEVSAQLLAQVQAVDGQGAIPSVSDGELYLLGFTTASGNPLTAEIVNVPEATSVLLVALGLGIFAIRRIG